MWPPRADADLRRREVGRNATLTHRPPPVRSAFAQTRRSAYRGPLKAHGEHMEVLP